MDEERQLERLHIEHAAAVRGYVRRRIGSVDADDVVADVFVVAWRRIADAPAEPRAWLLGIARKVLGNRRRSSQRQRALYERLAQEAESAPPAACDPSGVTPTGDGRVLRALATLSPADREVLLLVTWDGLTNAEAARVLGVRVGTAAQRLRRARLRLQRALDPPGTAARRPTALGRSAWSASRPDHPRGETTQ